MTSSSGEPSKRILEPMERLSEILFGLIMALVVSGTLSIAQAGQPEVRSMVYGALGCNLAWGIIDAGMYLMACLAQRGHGIVILRALRKPAESTNGQRLIADALPPVVASVMTTDQLEKIRQQLIALPDLPRRTWLEGRDFLGALGVCLLVVLSTLPVVVPFLFDSDIARAMKISRVIGIAMLFLAGYQFGRYAGLNGWVIGIAMVIVGAILVLMTIALGG